VLSIVIPTLDAAVGLPATLATLGAAELHTEIVVADGGSADATADLAAASGARVIPSPPGRGGQLAAGAEASVGAWLLFLHADTRPGPGWSTVVQRFMAEPDNIYRAAYFQFALDDPAPAARRLQRVVDWRCRTLGLPYGDQGLLISRTFYDHLGGFRPIPLMEDVDMVRRIGKRRLVPLAAQAVTSAERYRRDGYLLRPALNLLCLGLYLLGAPLSMIQGIYK